jgi:hypothetical protein
MGISLESMRKALASMALYDKLYGTMGREYVINISTRIQRHYTQAGPWAEMLREG